MKCKYFRCSNCDPDGLYPCTLIVTGWTSHSHSPTECPIKTASGKPFWIEIEVDNDEN